MVNKEKMTPNITIPLFVRSGSFESPEASLRFYKNAASKEELNLAIFGWGAQFLEQFESLGMLKCYDPQKIVGITIHFDHVSELDWDEGPTFNFKGVQNVTNNILNEVLGVSCRYIGQTVGTTDHEGTGHWLQRDSRFIRWKDTPGSLWIKGIPFQCGSSSDLMSVQLVLEKVSTVIKEITGPDRVVAYFYFDFRNKRQHMDIMLRSIIWQLSGQSPSPYSALHQLYESLGDGTRYPQPDEVLRVLESEWKHLLKFIHTLCQSAKKTLHLLFTSQPLQEFETAFKGVIFIELGGSGISTRDIRSSVGSEVLRVRNWASNDKNAEHVTKQILQKSNGMFRMAACLIELGRCHRKDDWEAALKALPADLFGIYCRFLTRATDSLKTAFVQAIFRWLVFSAKQVTSDELENTIAFQLDDSEFDFSDMDKSKYRPDRWSDQFRQEFGTSIDLGTRGGVSGIRPAHPFLHD
ncbi:hypothetical protein C8R45DRAFT_934385 [Mycena sanguinolenta]|nr:hypothetical protein C8R45DRAFT_934385 [Mycena sanguinolenta]